MALHLQGRTGCYTAASNPVKDAARRRAANPRMRARRLALAVEWQIDVNPRRRARYLADRDADVLAVLAGVGCGARPQPRSSRMPAADTRAAGGTASWLTIPASTLMHSSVCPRASERKSAGIFFRGKCLRGGPTPLLLAQASSPRLLEDLTAFVAHFNTGDAAFRAFRYQWARPPNCRERRPAGQITPRAERPKSPR